MCGSTSALSRSTVPGHCAAAVGALVPLDAAVEQHLHAHADAQHGAAAGEPVVDDARPVDRAQAGHAGGERADPGDDEPVGLQRRVPVRGHRDVRTHPAQRTLGRAQVARPVVQHDDPRHVPRIGDRGRRALGHGPEMGARAPGMGGRHRWSGSPTFLAFLSNRREEPIMTEYIPTVVVGAGQAGLALSHCLTARGLEHVVLDRGTIAHSWRTQRWDSFSAALPQLADPTARLPLPRSGSRRVHDGRAGRRVLRGVRAVLRRTGAMWASTVRAHAPRSAAAGWSPPTPAR